jgi:hypothetical protein
MKEECRTQNHILVSWKAALVRNGVCCEYELS